jgi:hypothetical protein
MLGYSFNQMFSTYWTVKSFEINVTASVISSIDPFSEFVSAGGTTGGIIGAIGGLGAISTPADSFTTARGYTKIYSKYSKRVRKAREGIINNETQSDVGGDKALDLDENIDPNKLEAFTYKPNEGTLCSAGPVHVFSKNNVSIILDFSDIKYYAYRKTRLYWPNVTVFVGVGKAAFGNTISSQVLPGPPGPIFQPIPIINLNAPGTTANLGTTLINSQKSISQFANVIIDIRPGKRCCDRFFWDGKDQERLESSDDPNNDDNPCNKVCGDDEEKGVYSKTVSKIPNI